MKRINLALKEDTFERLDRVARRAQVKRTALARELLREGLRRREAQERTVKLAKDYASEPGADADLLAALEAHQLELLEDE